MAPSFTPAPLPADALARTLAPFGESRMLPVEAYTSDDVFAWEKANFFSGWTCLGRSSDIAEPGMQRADKVGDTTALLVRGEDGVLRGFANVCRHRGHEILPCGGTAQARAITCPYHSWSYKLDGQLFSAAGYAGFGSFDMGDFPLRPLAVEEWHGFVFIDLRHGRLAVRSSGRTRGACGAVPSRDSRGAWQSRVRDQGELENHHGELPGVLPLLVHPPRALPGEPARQRRELGALGGAWVGGYLDLMPHAVTMSLDGSSNGAFIPGLSDEEMRRIDYIGVFPNLLISLHPDYVMTHRAVPLSPGETWVECAWAFPPEATAKPDFDPAYAMDFWDITNREDWSACESVQRGMESGFAVPGPLAPDEDAIYQFVTMVARGYLGQPLPAVQQPAKA